MLGEHFSKESLKMLPSWQARACIKTAFTVGSPNSPKIANQKIKELSIGGSSNEVMAYAAPPEDTAKSVARNIPPYDTQEDIARSLVNKRNPTVLQARRMGHTNSPIIVFEGGKVPHCIFYCKAEYRCSLHKKRHEVCNVCGPS